MRVLNGHLGVANRISARTARKHRRAFFIAVVTRHRPEYNVLLGSVCREEITKDQGAASDVSEEIMSATRANGNRRQDGNDTEESSGM